MKTRLRVRRRLHRLRGDRPSPVRSLVLRHPRLAAALIGSAVGGSAWVLTGPVGAVVVSAYVGLAASHAVRRHRVAAADAARSHALDAVTALAADLRVGTTPDVAWAAARPTVDPVAFIRDRAETAWRVADTTGAPLADLLDRLQSDLRLLERIRLAASAHAAGIRATAVLLAMLPLAGIGLGYGMNGDPVRVLLHTPLGAACAIVATLLQLAGFAWTTRLARMPAVTRESRP